MEKDIGMACQKVWKQDRDNITQACHPRMESFKIFSGYLYMNHSRPSLIFATQLDSTCL